MTAHNFIDLTEQLFDRLTVLSRAANGSDGRTRWMCQCSCGALRVVDAKALRRRATKSCGCFKIEENTQRSRTHGMAHTAEYFVWKNMKARCLNPRSSRYADYGGRGITICARWQDSFVNFYEDMGPRPGPKYTIERVRNSEGYAPDNCIWATLSVQARNKRTSLSFTLNDITQSLLEWAQSIGMNYHTLYYRLQCGLSLEEAMARPLQIHKNNIHKHIE